MPPIPKFALSVTSLADIIGIKLTLRNDTLLYAA